MTTALTNSSVPPYGYEASSDRVPNVMEHDQGVTERGVDAQEALSRTERDYIARFGAFWGLEVHGHSWEPPEQEDFTEMLESRRRVLDASARASEASGDFVTVFDQTRKQQDIVDRATIESSETGGPHLEAVMLELLGEAGDESSRIVTYQADSAPSGLWRFVPLDTGRDRIRRRWNALSRADRTDKVHDERRVKVMSAYRHIYPSSEDMPDHIVRSIKQPEER